MNRRRKLFRTDFVKNENIIDELDINNSCQDKKMQDLTDKIDLVKKNLNKYNSHIGIGFNTVAVFSDVFMYNCDEIATKKYVKNAILGVDSNIEHTKNENIKILADMISQIKDLEERVISLEKGNNILSEVQKLVNKI